jgi:hypothetical protein
MNVTYSEYGSVAVVIRHAVRMHPTMLLSVACLALTHFPTLSHKQHSFRKKKFNLKCVLCLSLGVLSKPFVILRRNERDIVINMHESSCKIPVTLVRL